MKNNLLKVSIGILVVCFFTACASVRKAAEENNPFKEKRPFQERNFDARLWREGDAQTRGEMTKDLRWKKAAPQGYILDDKNRRQILEILGEPDRKTRGRCCGAGGTFDEEVWLYNIEVQEDSEIKNEHFQIYFDESGDVDEWRVAAWDDKNPDYFPRVG